MTDKWILQDIEQSLVKRNRVVIIDPKGQYQFMLPIIEKHGYSIIKTDQDIKEGGASVKEELLLRYEIETKYKDKPLVIYISKEQNNLSFLFDYCFTHGCIDLTNPTDWLKKKLFANTGLQVQMETPMLITAAKLGIGKDLAWWKKILQNLEELLNIEEELLPFLHAPDNYLDGKDADVKRLFEEKIFELIGQPFMNKPAKTLAEEVGKRLFDGLLHNDIPNQLLQLYYRWADSEKYKSSLKEYISKYKIDSSNLNPWAAHSDHCFPALDQIALTQMTSNISDKSFITDKLLKLKTRVYSSKVQHIVPAWWKDIFAILEFDSKLLNALTDINKLIEFYTTKFWEIDRAIRNLYVSFLQEEKIIRPLQESYESLNHLLLEQWFSFIGSYKETQQGYLPKLLANAKPGTAIIVGDGVRYEIAKHVSDVLQKQLKVERHTMLADMPSETEHNMSALYVGNREVLAKKEDREKKLNSITGKDIAYMDLEALSYGVKADYLVLSYKDIDSAGEKLQQGATKLFEEFEQVLIAKITLLLNIGFKEVHLITDHGFVLTGLLEESDKIEANVKGKKEVHERFIRTQDKQDSGDLICFEEPYGEYKYVCASKSHRPFRSKGVYGYSHGGFTPQEIIIPNFVFKKERESTSGLQVIISNKSDLVSTTGEYFAIKLQASSDAKDLFGSNRKVQIILYNGNVNVSSGNIITIDSGTICSMDFGFNKYDELKAVLVDATTQEQLDTVIIKKSNLRDFGGLL